MAKDSFELAAWVGSPLDPPFKRGAKLLTLLRRAGAILLSFWRGAIIV